MNKNEIKLYFGLLADSIDIQLKKQGFKDKKCKRHQSEINSLILLKAHGIITDKQADSIENKIFKEIVKNIEVTE